MEFYTKCDSFINSIICRNGQARTVVGSMGCLHFTPEVLRSKSKPITNGISDFARYTRT